RAHALRFRDGKAYQHNLAAVRSVMDSQTPDAWENNIYMNWLACLRELSAPTTDAKFPEAMRTRAWAMKTLNTQMASWTQLRHDTVLYVKEPYPPPFGCSYPYGFVEPRPEFWKQMRILAESTEQGLAKAQARLQDSYFLHDFAETMRILEGIADKELTQQPLSATESVFLQHVVETVDYVGWLQ